MRAAPAGFTDLAGTGTTTGQLSACAAGSCIASAPSVSISSLPPRFGSGKGVTARSLERPKGVRACPLVAEAGTAAIVSVLKAAIACSSAAAVFTMKDRGDTNMPALLRMAGAFLPILLASTVFAQPPSAVPWQPQTAWARWVGEQARGQTVLMAGNPDVVVHHMHDPNQDRLMLHTMAYYRLKFRRLPAAYRPPLGSSFGPAFPPAPDTRGPTGRNCQL